MNKFYTWYVVTVANFMSDSRKMDRLFTAGMIIITAIGLTAVTLHLLNDYFPGGWHQ